VDVGRNTIHNAREMEKQDILNGPYWFSIYTTFCATLSLVFYVWENADVQGTLQTLKDAEYGRDVLVKLAYKSMAAVRHSETLSVSFELLINSWTTLLTLIQIIFTRLPERLGKSRRKQSKPQRKRRTSLPKQNEPRESHSDQDIVETPYNSRAFTQAADAVDLGGSQLQDAPLNPLHFPNIPETSPHDNFTRFLGPNSIEDLFRPQFEHSGDVVSPNLGPTVTSLSQNLDSLDQYASMLDLQKGQENPHDIDDSVNGVSSLHYARSGNVTIDNTRVRPFIPLSPYLMQMYPPGSSLVPPESCALLTEDYYTEDQIDNPQGAGLQGMLYDQEIFWARADG
jgi:hypothetical protein